MQRIVSVGRSVAFRQTFLSTEPELALDMMRELVHARCSLPVVTFDEHLGESPSLLDEIDALGKWYLAECLQYAGLVAHAAH